MEIWRTVFNRKLKMLVTAAARGWEGRRLGIGVIRVVSIGDGFADRVDRAPEQPQCPCSYRTADLKNV